MPFKVRPAAMPAQNGGHVPAETLPLRPAATSTQNGGYVTQSGRYVIQNGGHVPDENLQLRPAAMSTQNGGNVPAEGLPLQPAAIPTQPGGPIPAQGFPGRYYHPSYQIVKERLHAYSVNAMQGRLFLAPICDPSRILNVGCGMGITTSHLGSLFPRAEVWGCDEEKLELPILLEKPNNVQISSANLNTLVSYDPHFRDESQDFIFSRGMMISMTDWEGYMEAAFQLLKPGGYFEVQEEELDIMINEEPVCRGRPWFELYRRALPQLLQIDCECARKVETWMKDAGFRNIKVTFARLPVGDWAAKKGWVPETRAYCVNNAVHEAIHSTEVYQRHLEHLARKEGCSDEDIAAFQADVAYTLFPRDGTYKQLVITIGQKPLKDPNEPPPTVEEPEDHSGVDLANMSP